MGSKLVEHKEEPEKEDKVRKAIIKIRDIALITIFWPVAVVSLLGCGPAEELPKSDKKAPTATEPPKVAEQQPICESIHGKPLYWWPGYIVRNGEVIDVSLHYLDYYQPSQKPEETFTSEKQVPEEMRQKGRDGMVKVLNTAKFFLNEKVRDSLIENNVFTFFTDASIGGYYTWGPKGFRLVDLKDKEVACCFEKCPLNEVGVSLYGSAGLHELLHDAWATYVSEKNKQKFADDVSFLLNACGGTWQMDELLGAIWHSGYHNDPKDLSSTKKLDFEYFLKGPELDNWAAEELTSKGVDESEAARIKDGVRAYIQVRAITTFSQTYGADATARKQAIVSESYARLSCNYNVLDKLYNGQIPEEAEKWLPEFMKQDYAGIMKDDALDKMAQHAGGYFATKETLQTLMPYIESFVNWMKAKYPELENAGK